MELKSIKLTESAEPHHLSFSQLITVCLVRATVVGSERASREQTIRSQTQNDDAKNCLCQTHKQHPIRVTQTHDEDQLWDTSSKEKR